VEDDVNLRNVAVHLRSSYLKINTLSEIIGFDYHKKFFAFAKRKSDFDR
jgi:hypothetical protein